MIHVSGDSAFNDHALGVRGLPPECVLLTLDSPGVTFPAPIVMGRERMPPDIAGIMEGLWRETVFAASPVRIAMLQDVFVVKEGLVFDQAGCLFDFSRTQHGEDEVAEAAAWVRAHGAQAMRFAGPHVLCKKRGVVNYGHWMLEMLPKMFLAARHLDLAGLRYLVPASGTAMTRVIANSADRLGVGAGQRLVLGSEVAFFHELIVVDGLTWHGSFMSPLVLPCLAALAERVPGAGFSRVFVTRPATRAIANQAAVLHAAAAAGYVTVDPGKLSLAQQIAVFKDALEIVGIMGAAMTNIVFAAPGARVVTLAPASMPDTFFWYIAGLRGLSYREVRCRQTGPVRGHAPWDSDMVVDPADLPHIFRNEGGSHTVAMP